jgi:hypothetical protein
MVQPKDEPFVTRKSPMQLSLVKGIHRYQFWYDEGAEDGLVEQLMQWADEDELDFDWFDAAVLSRQLNRRLLGEVPNS